MDSERTKSIARRRAKIDAALERALGRPPEIAVASAREPARETIIADASSDETRERDLDDAACGELARRAKTALEGDANAFEVVALDCEAAYEDAETSTPDASDAAMRARAREDERREGVRETRYAFRRDMIDDAEASEDVNDRLVETWNAMLRRGASDEDDAEDDDGDGDDDDDDDDDFVDPMELHERFTEHVAACERALEPKQSLVHRLERHLVADVDEKYKQAIAEHRAELDSARQTSRRTNEAREQIARDVGRDARLKFAARGAARDATRAETLRRIDCAADVAATSRGDRARRDENASRAALIQLTHDNAREMSELRAALEGRFFDASARLHEARARAPLTSERFRDAIRDRAKTQRERKTIERAARRAVKSMRAELYDAKQRYEAMEAFHVRLDARLRLETRQARDRLEAMLERVERASSSQDKAKAIFAMKRARIEKLARALAAVERTIWKKVLCAPDAPRPIDEVVRSALSEHDASAWDNDWLSKVLNDRTRAWVRLEREMRRRE